MSATLGLSVSPASVRAVCIRHGQIKWVGTVEYSDTEGLGEAIFALSEQCPLVPDRVRVVLERTIVQLRTIQPAPPVAARSLRRYVDLQAPRLFRRNGTPLVTDAVLLPSQGDGRILWVAGAPSDVVCAVITGCNRGGLRLEALGAAAEVLPAAVEGPVPDGEIFLPNGGGTEVISVDRGRVWRSRWVREERAPVTRLVPTLEQLGEPARLYAAAFGAATRLPSLALFPEEERAAKERVRRTRAFGVVAVAVLFWIVAAGVYVARLAAVANAADRGYTAIAAEVDSVLTLRRELAAVRLALTTAENAERHRSRTLALLAHLTAALGDSTFLTSLRLSRDSTLMLGGYSRVAASVLAELEQLRWLRDVRFEAPVTRETHGRGIGRGSWDRFAVVAGLGQYP